MPSFGTSKASGTGRQVILVAGLGLVTLASGAFIYWTQVHDHGVNEPLQRAVGETLAEETAHVAGSSGKIVLITVNAGLAPELKVQLDAYERELKRLGNFAIKDRVVLDPADNPNYRPGAGLSAKRFLKIIHKHPDADAIVSFIGAPALSDAELAQLKTVPRFIAEAHSPEKLALLIQKKVLLAAVVPRFEFPAPGPTRLRTSRDWFDRYFQIISPQTPLPPSDGSP